MANIDYLNPDYTDVFQRRQQKLTELRSNPELLAALKLYYKDNPWDFISDWGFTFDPRQIEKGLLPNIPFIVWPKQEEYLRWIDQQWKNGEYGIVEKSRDCGVTWLSVAYACSNWLFIDGFSVGFGSAKEDKVDKKGDPDCIFEKIRFFLAHVPPEFMPEDYIERVHSGFMKMINPNNGATITGDAGDQIGRGGRKSIYFVDESAFVERQMAVANSLSQATNCQIDISTFNGNGNLFYRNSLKFQGTRRKFIFDWRDDPRKDEAWYQKQKDERDPITVAQEIDRDPNASAEDVFIPSQWVQAALDLHKLIKVLPTGIKVTAFDPADTGDAKAICSRHGYVVTAAELLTDGDITQAIPWAYNRAYINQSEILTYDADGMGAPVMKMAFGNYQDTRLEFKTFYGSGVIEDPNKRYGEKPGDTPADRKMLKKNKDTFLNFRSQAGTWLRDRFENAYIVRKQIEAGGMVLDIDFDNLISIDSECVNRFELIAELSRPKRLWTNNGKIKVEGKKEMKARQIESPNLFDALMMCMATKVPKVKKSNRGNIQTRSIRARDPGVGM
tara:strand:+ start:364 stop:2037 length:1674 start_codon:yes stop_codon:yes gene_type:complete